MPNREHTDKFLGKKVLVMGLGLHGGGVATVRWLVHHGAKVTVTDLRTRKVLASSLHQLKGLRVHLVLGKHRMADFITNEVVVVGPGVPRENPYVLAAKKAGKMIENDAGLFFRYLENPVIAVTGTRGKTTTTLWVAALLKKKYPAVRASGTPENAELKESERINGKNTPAVVELSSWQLEYLPQSDKAPHIAAITNIYPEHLNRYRGITHYADAKANIFLHQNERDMLVINYDDPWHKYFLKKKPKSALYYISKKALPKKLRGAYIKNAKFTLRIAGREQPLFSIARFRKERGEHNLENLLRAVLMAKLFAPMLRITERDALSLPTPRMRQEIILKKKKLTVVNDSCATSPDGTIAAIKRFASSNTRSGLKNCSSRPDLVLRRKPIIILITGGTDKNLDFGGLAKEIKKHIPKQQLVLLEGSATTKLIAALRTLKYFGRYEPLEYLSLESCVKEAFRVAAEVQGLAPLRPRSGLEEQFLRPDLGHRLSGRTLNSVVILFSPGAASFEKFLHEFDRGGEFNALVRRMAVPITI